MEVEKVTSRSSDSTTVEENNNSDIKINNNNKSMNKEDQDQDQGALPGFRFHPTDEELVGFYLKRKVEKRPIRIELIKQIDIYKYDPWDLPRDKEWYFFCIRGRKYRNSIRPNRVTGSGFWKATGIDKPIYSVKEPHDCIGLKKSLVYYRGSAGKGTKTDWMMHEFRLPPITTPSTSTSIGIPFGAKTSSFTTSSIARPAHPNFPNPKDNPIISQEAEIEMFGPNNLETDHNDPYHKTLELDSNHHHHNGNAQFLQRNKRSSKPVASNQQSDLDQTSRGSWFHVGHIYNNNVNVPLAAHQQYHHQGPIFPSFNMNPNTADPDFFTNESWDELRSVVQLAVDRHPSQLSDGTDMS
ncbi:hypothetical protein TIFTF001_024111 [Ficus carica]|uniref:NAC domain-containing protein n=1 Tax=Ficus carica TaxID=3494 RepID=A0AA88AKS9_FICCA|nr:hypothetical protein TIFTF001_024111 [Ficus carica]